MEFNLETIHHFISQSIHELRIKEYDDSKIRVYMPFFLTEHFFRAIQYDEFFQENSSLRYRGIKVIEGYERAIIVSHIDAAFKNEQAFKMPLI